MNLFYPLCLSRRTLYPRRRICEHVLQHHLLEDAKAAVVVCDWIFAVGEKAEAPAMGWQRLLASARRRGENLFNMARNVAVKAGLEEQVRLGYWQEFARGPTYYSVRRALLREIRGDKLAYDICSEFVDEHIRRESLQNASSVRRLEYYYLISEMALSVYMTEIKGHAIEIWEPQIVNTLDPIRFIYDERPGIIKKASGVKELHRKQIDIFWPLQA